MPAGYIHLLNGVLAGLVELNAIVEPPRAGLHFPNRIVRRCPRRWKRRTSLSGFRNALPDFDVRQDDAMNGIGVIGKKIELTQFVLKRGKLGLGPTLLHDAFPKRLE